ncbi:MAG: DUF4178 domain-containing protein [Gemmatimonadales bacterium]|nr:DUF4178 domain-containing protein [Gemmatimonadales bacterium]
MLIQVRLPALRRDADQSSALLDGGEFRHFQTVEAETVYVIGEFPWEVRTGDRVTCADYVDPSRMLSSEVTDEEITWSVGDYLAAGEVYTAVGLGAAPAPRGVFASQPNPAAVRFDRMLPRLALAHRNLTLARRPELSSRDAEPAWDNVVYDSRSLGYVDTRHQSLATVPGAPPGPGIMPSATSRPLPRGAGWPRPRGLSGAT